MVMASDFEDSFDNDITNRSSESNSRGEEGKKLSFFSLAYFQQFFDVDTNIVRERIMSLSIPNRDPEAMKKINKKPDLYGPFWIVVTLIFAIAVSGNVADFLRNYTNHKWHYNFHLLSIAATIIISYVILVPLGLWATLQWTKKGEEVAGADEFEEDQETGPSPTVPPPNLLALICCYGYSLATYIPVSLLWTVQISFLQWILMLATSISSGLALLLLLRSSLVKSKYGFGLTIGVVALHFLLAAGLMFYFFHGSASDIADNPVIVQPPKPSITINATN